MRRDISPEKHIRIRIEALAEEQNLGGIGLFIYDFDSLYELMRMAVDSKYADYEFNRFSLYRNGRPISQEDKLRVDALSLGSPLEIAGLIAAYAGATSSVLATIWMLVQLIEKITNYSLNREKLELEVETLRRELEDAPAGELSPMDGKLASVLEERKAQPYINQAANRLHRSTLRIVGFSVRLEQNDGS